MYNVQCILYTYLLLLRLLLLLDHNMRLQFNTWNVFGRLKFVHPLQWFRTNCVFRYIFACRNISLVCQWSNDKLVPNSQSVKCVVFHPTFWWKSIDELNSSQNLCVSVRFSFFNFYDTWKRRILFGCELWFMSWNCQWKFKTIKWGRANNKNCSFIKQTISLFRLSHRVSMYNIHGLNWLFCMLKYFFLNVVVFFLLPI